MKCKLICCTAMSNNSDWVFVISPHAAMPDKFFLNTTTQQSWILCTATAAMTDGISYILQRSDLCNCSLLFIEHEFVLHWYHDHMFLSAQQHWSRAERIDFFSGLVQYRMCSDNFASLLCFVYECRLSSQLDNQIVLSDSAILSALHGVALQQFFPRAHRSIAFFLQDWQHTWQPYRLNGAFA